MKRTMWAMSLATALWAAPGCQKAQTVGQWLFGSRSGEDSRAVATAKALEQTGILGPTAQWVLLITSTLQNAFLGGKQIHKQVKKRKAKP